MIHGEEAHILILDEVIWMDDKVRECLEKTGARVMFVGHEQAIALSRGSGKSEAMRELLEAECAVKQAPEASTKKMPYYHGRRRF